MGCDDDIGWDAGVYGDAVSAGGWPDMDPPPKDPAAPFVSGGSAKGWGTSATTKFTGTYIERPGGLTGLSGQPEQPRYP
jgi:hypothetical protein